MNFRGFSAVAFMALFLAAPRDAAPEEKVAAPRSRPDAWVAAKARIVLWTDNDVEGSAIDVDVKDSVVTLSGSAATEAAKAEAERRVKGLDGVQGVRNLVQIVPSRDKKKVEAADKTVRTAVEARLKSSPGLKDIMVDNVAAGVVLLKGTGTLDEAATAIKLTRTVPGVKRVISQIASPA